MDVISANRGRWLAGALGLLMTLAGCSNFIGTTAGSFMRVVREDTDPNKRHQAYQKLADPRSYTSDDQKRQATQLLSERLRKGDEPVASRAMICRTLGQIGLPEARDALAMAATDPEPVIRAEAVRALGHVGLPDDAILLTRVMSADSDPDTRMAAIDGLSVMTSPDPRALTMLVEGMQDQDPAVRLASVRALRSITGKDFGVKAEDWRAFTDSLQVEGPNAGATDLP